MQNYSFTAIKTFHEASNHISYELCHTSGKLVGYQGFTESQYNALRTLSDAPLQITTQIGGSASANHPFLKEWTPLYETMYKFQVTEQQVDNAGIMYLLNRKRKWATSTHKNDTNPNFELVSVAEAIKVCCE